MVCSAQGCEQITATSCNDIEVFYGPLLESHGPSADDPDIVDFFYSANLYYKSQNNNLQSIHIEFNRSSFETTTGTSSTSFMLNSPTLIVGNTSPLPVTPQGSYSRLGTVVWRINTADYGLNPLGKQKFTFFNTSGQPISGCEPNFVYPPSLSHMNNEELPELTEAYLPQ